MPSLYSACIYHPVKGLANVPCKHCTHTVFWLETLKAPILYPLRCWSTLVIQVEIVCASMGNTLGSVGGFCVGTEEIVEHQRLSGSGYCFSASLPPFLATAASHTLAQLQQDGSYLIKKLHANVAILRRELSKLPEVVVMGGVNELSPLIHLRLANQPADRKEAEQLLSKISDHVLTKGSVLTCVAYYSNLDRVQPPPSLRVVATALLDEKDCKAAVNAISQALKQYL